MNRKNGRNSRGFTLMELLVVLALMVILFGIVLLMVNPVEAVKKGRDSHRLSDLKTIEQAISSSINYGIQQGVSQSTILCGATAPCSGLSTDANSRNNNGTGWVKVNLKNYSTVNYGALPVDPVNDSNFHYTYTSDGSDWEIATKMESKSYANLNSPTTGFYAIGTSTNLVNFVTYSNLPITVTCTISPSSGTTSTTINVQFNGSATTGCVGVSLSGDPPVASGSSGCGQTVTYTHAYNYYTGPGIKHVYANVTYNNTPAGSFECSGSPITIN